MQQPLALTRPALRTTLGTATVLAAGGGVVAVALYPAMVYLLVLLIILAGVAAVALRGGQLRASIVIPALGEDSKTEVPPAIEPRRDSTRERLVYLAYHDELTGLPNRSHWQELLRTHIRGATERSDPTGFAVMFIDLDNFKDVNDALGHAKGDDVLVEAASRLREALRPYDIIGRLGGDEFAVLLPELRHPGETREIANRLLEGLRLPYTVQHRAFELGGSIGIAHYPEHGTSVEALLQHSDVALYSAKRSGGNCHRVYMPAMSDEHDHYLDMKQALVRAMRAEEFSLHYQPLLDLRTGQCDHAEALIRWNDPDKGLVSPGQFIGIAEESGLMQGIGRWTFETAVKQLQVWNRVNRQVRVSLNASAKHFQDPSFFDHLSDTLRTAQVSPEQVQLEVTESVAVADIESATDTLSRLQRIGTKTVLDDFGTHYSSLKYLQELPINTIKVDASFVRGLPHNEHDAAIVRGVISLGHDLGRTIVAEGVETRDQLDWLRRASCDVVQGYLVERPMTAQRFERWQEVQVPYALAG